MPLTKWQPPAWRHDVDDEGRVTWLELFFDLVYVAALIQLGDRLSGDVTWTGAAAFLGSFVILWWTWTGTTAFMNGFPVDDVVHRLLAFIQMFAVGNIAVLAATNPSDWEQWLAFSYVAARLPLLIMYWRVRRRVPDARATADHFLRYFGFSAILWLVSAAMPGNARFILWATALVIEFVAPLIRLRRAEADDDGQGRQQRVYAEHFQERYGLFTIIVLGETFVKTLTEVSEIGITTRGQIFGTLAFLMLIALWWTYFDDVAEAHIRSESAVSRSPATNRLVWVYTHLPLALGLTAFGVAAKKIISTADFSAPFGADYTWLLTSALVIVLVSVAVLDLVTVSSHFAVDAPERIGPRLVAAALLIPVAILMASETLDALPGLGLITAIAVGQIAVEVVIAQRSEYRLGREVQSQIDDLAGRCAHLEDIESPVEPRTRECTECSEHGVDWVQLRWCLTCGHVACCDDTPGQHATGHFHETGHEVMASIEPGATWAYCYVDEVTDPDWRARRGDEAAAEAEPS